MSLHGAAPGLITVARWAHEERLVCMPAVLSFPTAAHTWASTRPLRREANAASQSAVRRCTSCRRRQGREERQGQGALASHLRNHMPPHHRPR